ncbi:hypothetical protein COCCADRAFT_41916 [Bipolaris zeicola 26-R-13]|uniref:Uncharacterized protein n=1 Tax=Cochliobolus carbonum (strain 26-R-13) TaxID=930089 RepID=W6Y8B6_COCC2|nr:uncharacterized protein COCCADRAFT_41916 [Bipolaris zeicola 26-R-13]EUC27336.1 hypothetical protein COCCADRAFT_41916 [Bipolaris zeicola 26-R-13]
MSLCPCEPTPPPPFGTFDQQEPAASVNHSTPVPGRIKGQNMLRASSLAKPQRLQLLVPQKTSPSHSKLKCSQPCQFHTLPVPVPGPAIPMHCPPSSRRPPPTATCRINLDTAETNASSSPAVSNTLAPSSPLPLSSRNLIPDSTFFIGANDVSRFPTKKTWLVRSLSETLAVTERKHLETSLHLAHGTGLPRPDYT